MSARDVSVNQHAGKFRFPHLSHHCARAIMDLSSPTACSASGPWNDKGSDQTPCSSEDRRSKDAYIRYVRASNDMSHVSAHGKYLRSQGLKAP